MKCRDILLLLLLLLVLLTTTTAAIAESTTTININNKVSEPVWGFLCFVYVSDFVLS